MRLSNAVLQALKKAGVSAYFADRATTKTWNEHRAAGEPLMYGGWYWERTQKGRVVAQDTEGPFSSESAALRDAFVKLQLRA